MTCGLVRLGGSCRSPSSRAEVCAGLVELATDTPSPPPGVALGAGHDGAAVLTGAARPLPLVPPVRRDPARALQRREPSRQYPCRM